MVIGRKTFAGLVATLGLLACVVACDALLGISNDPVLQDAGASSTDAPALDAGDASADASAPDADAANDAAGACDASTPFGTPVLVKGLETQEILSARLSADELTMFLASQSGPNVELMTATRMSTSAAFSITGLIPVVNASGANQFWPTPTADGRLIFFESDRSLTPDDAGQYTSVVARIWSSSRVNVDTDFAQPQIQSLFQVDGGAEGSPYLHPLGRSLYFASLARPGLGGLDLFVADLSGLGVVTGIQNVAGVNSAVEENFPLVSFDELALLFSRPDVGSDDTKRNIWRAERTTSADGFGSPQTVDELNTVFDEFPSWISSDSCRLYFISNRPDVGAADAAAGAYRVWAALRAP